MMHPQTLLQYLQQNIPANEQLLLHIASHFEERTLRKNEYLLKAGKVSDAYWYLEEGFLRAYSLDVHGEEVTTHFYAKNRMVFEVASFFMRTPSQENIQALSDSKGYAISFEKLNMLFHSIPEFREFGRSILVKSFVAFKQRALSSITETAEEQYAKLLATNPEVFQYAPLKHIASYLGITDSSLSRIRREFSKK